MKLPKVLLSAMVAGVAVAAATSSCSKKEKEVVPVQAQPSGENIKPNIMPPAPCPVCGMG